MKIKLNKLLKQQYGKSHIEVSPRRLGHDELPFLLWEAEMTAKECAEKIMTIRRRKRSKAFRQWQADYLASVCMN